MFHPRSIPLLAVLTVFAVAVPPALAADMAAEPRTITVQGTGEVATSPDMAEVTVGVTREAPTAEPALTGVATAMEHVLRAARSFDIADRDIQTRSVNVQPRYARPPGARPGEAAKISHYVATYQVHLRIRDIGKLGVILDALVAAGANQMHGVQFTLSDPKTAMDEARRKAVADARARAELYAAASGVKLGKVLRIAEASTAGPRPLMMTASAIEARSVPIAPGETTIRANVRMVFAIE